MEPQGWPKISSGAPLEPIFRRLLLFCIICCLVSLAFSLSQGYINKFIPSFRCHFAFTGCSCLSHRDVPAAPHAPLLCKGCPQIFPFSSLWANQLFLTGSCEGLSHRLLLCHDTFPKYLYGIFFFTLNLKLKPCNNADTCSVPQNSKTCLWVEQKVQRLKVNQITGGIFYVSTEFIIPAQPAKKQGGSAV